MPLNSKVIAFIPGNHYIPLTLSGTYCELNCPYCRGIYLKGMTDVSTPELLRKILKIQYERGVRGFLLSGGFNREGYLIISEEQLKTVAEFKKEHSDTVISIHLGLAPKKLVESVWSSNIDYVDYEVPPSNRYLRVMKNLPSKNVDDYIELLDFMLGLDRSFSVPHMVVDSITSTQEEEMRVMNLIAGLKPTQFTVLVEIRGNALPNRYERVRNTLKEARKLFQKVSLGCMRSPGFKIYDREWILEGLIDRIAVPRPALIKELKLPLVYACCGVPDDKLSLFPLQNF